MCCGDHRTFSPTCPEQDEDESQDKQKLHLTDKAEWQYSDREKENLEVFYTRTARGNRIACMFVKCAPNARFTILHSHGNAVDLGQMSSFYLGLGSRINCNIFSYDYSGYGVSGGRPSEKNLYADIEAAWHAMRTKLGISPENIILYGQSIGTVPTVDLASRFEVGMQIVVDLTNVPPGRGGDPAQPAHVWDARGLPSDQEDLVLRRVPEVNV
jgi:hypothetical protein